MMIDDVEANDPSYAEPRAILRDFIDVLNELADLLTSVAAAGEFGRHAPFLARADALIAKLSRTVDPALLDLFRPEAELAISRLRAAFMVSDVQGRA